MLYKLKDMEQHTIRLTTNAGYEVRTEQRSGREYWVVPVVMMVEGVHNGSHGPLLYPAEELSAFPSMWNGTPVVINHPAGGESANRPEAAEQVIGNVYNAYWSDNKLKAEAWLDVLQVTAMSPETAQLLQEQRPLDVSIGVYTEDEETEGTWNNEHYIAIARNYRPDHLAILPDADGACSWNDGCGIRNNKQKGGLMNDKKDDKSQSAEKKIFDIALIGNQLTENAPGFYEISNNIQRQLDRQDSETKMHFLEEVYDDYFIYRVSDRASGSTFYKSNYSVLSDGSVGVEGVPVQVRKNVTYEPLTSNMERTKFNSNLKTMADTKKAPCRIDALIANEATQFTEEDRQWLESLDDAQLNKLAPKEVKPSVENEKPKKEQVTNEKKEDPVQPKSVEDQMKDLIKNSANAEEYLDKFFPPELAEQYKAGLKMHRDKRKQLIKAITENSDFTEEEVNDFDTTRLEKLAKSVAKQKVSYIGNVSTDDPTETSDSGDEGIEDMLHINTAFLPKKEKVG